MSPTHSAQDASGEALLEQYSQHLMNVFGPPQAVLTRGEGAVVWDADGNRLLDLLGGLWPVQAQLFQAAQRIELQTNLAAGQHLPQSLYRRRQSPRRQIGPGDLAQGVHQNEPLLSLGRPQVVQQRLQQRLGFLLIAAGKEALADGFQGVGKANGVVGRDLAVGV